MGEATALGRRLRELRCWRGLNLREADGLAGLSFSFWGQVERGEKPVTKRGTLEAMAGALRVYPAELTGQPWTLQDPAGADTQAGLDAIETALDPDPAAACICSGHGLVGLRIYDHAPVLLQVGQHTHWPAKTGSGAGSRSKTLCAPDHARLCASVEIGE